MAVAINDQPIDTTFFNESQWMSDFVTPLALEVRELYDQLAKSSPDLHSLILNAWQWVATNVEYTPFVKGKLQIGRYTDVQSDLWMQPGMVIRTRIGNCANKSFLLASILRNAMPSDQVYVVLGNLNQPRNEGGHAWVEVELDETYILESTRSDMRPFTPASRAGVYEPVVYFNDEVAYAVEDRTVLQPFTAVYVDWLKDYLDMAYIEGGSYGTR